MGVKSSTSQLRVAMRQFPEAGAVTNVALTNFTVTPQPRAQGV